MSCRKRRALAFRGNDQILPDPKPLKTHHNPRPAFSIRKSKRLICTLETPSLALKVLLDRGRRVLCGRLQSPPSQLFSRPSSRLEVLPVQASDCLTADKPAMWTCTSIFHSFLFCDPHLVPRHFILLSAAVAGPLYSVVRATAISAVDISYITRGLLGLVMTGLLGEHLTFGTSRNLERQNISRDGQMSMKGTESEVTAKTLRRSLSTCSNSWVSSPLSSLSLPEENSETCTCIQNRPASALDPGVMELTR